MKLKPVDNLFFDGEYCSYDFQGYINGDAETGRRAAKAIIVKLGIPSGVLIWFFVNKF